MKVHIRLFAIAKELAFPELRTLDLPEKAVAKDVLSALSTGNPKFSEWSSLFRLAVNAEYVRSDHPLKDGDEVAVIPPVSGG